MSRDRFVRYEGYEGQHPTTIEVGRVISQYFGPEVATVDHVPAQRRFYVSLRGKWSSPLHGVVPLFPGDLAVGDLVGGERWIEVYVAEGEPIDVITRHADDYTNALADDLANVLGRGWGGKVERG
jgi:hypothetical protein